ncbi:MAG: hypothetical protein ABR532_10130 [Candidatus Dormibacteria bacterium]
MENHDKIPVWLMIALGASGVANLGVLGAYLNHRRWAGRST